MPITFPSSMSEGKIYVVGPKIGMQRVMKVLRERNFSEHENFLRAYFWRFWRLRGDWGQKKCKIFYCFNMLLNIELQKK